MEMEDIKYLWAGYKQGALASMGGRFAQPEMSPDEFKTEMENAILSQFHAAWTLLGPTRKGVIPIGAVFAAWAPNAPFLIVSGASFLPWASKRNIIEGMVGFLSKVRHEISLQFYATPEHKRLYEVCAMHGVVRRVGTSHVAIPGHRATVFETRTPEKRAA